MSNLNNSHTTQSWFNSHTTQSWRLKDFFEKSKSKYHKPFPPQKTKTVYFLEVFVLTAMVFFPVGLALDPCSPRTVFCRRSSPTELLPQQRLTSPSDVGLKSCSRTTHSEASLTSDDVVTPTASSVARPQHRPTLPSALPSPNPPPSSVKSSLMTAPSFRTPWAASP